jgi:transcription termination/antitermination protein NusA
LSLAIGKKGQNVRLASKLVGWDIHVMNQKKLDEQLNKSVGMFSQIPGVSEELAENLVEQGFFTFDDLSVIEPDQLAELGGLTEEQCDIIVAHADRESARIEEEERRAIAEGRLRPPEPVVVVEATVAPAEASAEPAAATASDESHETAGAEEVSETSAAGDNGTVGESADAAADAAVEESHESTTGHALADDATTMESPSDEPDAPEHAMDVTPGRNVEKEAAKVPQRANGESSPSLEAAALDEQAEE